MIALLLALAPVTVCHDIDGNRLSCKSAWAVDPHWKRPADCIPRDCTPRCAPRSVRGEAMACSEWTLPTRYDDAHREEFYRQHGYNRDGYCESGVYEKNGDCQPVYINWR